MTDNKNKSNKSKTNKREKKKDGTLKTTKRNQEIKSKEEKRHHT